MIPSPSQWSLKTKLIAGGVAVLALLVLAGFVWNWFHPSPAATVSAAAPVVSTAPPTRLEEKQTKPEVVTRTVIVRVPVEPKVKSELEHDFDVKLADPRPAAVPGAPPQAPPPGEVDLLTQVKLPSMAYGGTAIATLDSTGKTEVKVLPNKRPFFELGGVRETGVFYEALRGAAGVYHQQDLLRTGQIVWSGRVFASAPAPPLIGGAPADPKLNYGLELRAGIRW